MALCPVGAGLTVPSCTVSPTPVLLAFPARSQVRVVMVRPLYHGIMRASRRVCDLSPIVLRYEVRQL